MFGQENSTWNMPVGGMITKYGQPVKLPGLGASEATVSGFSSGASMAA